MQQLWVIAYDIEDDRSRRRVHELLGNHGQAVQYSVFECRLCSDEQQRLRNVLRPYLGPDDSIRWYPQCVWCQERREWQGGEGRPPGEEGYYIP